MKIAAAILIALIGLEHFGFLALEMFFWDKPEGLQAFHQTLEAATASKALAANQGLYNGFLGAGLLWSVWQGRRDTRLFFLGCVVIAGVYGAATAFIDILFIQAMPAAFAIVATILAQPAERS